MAGRRNVHRQSNKRARSSFWKNFTPSEQWGMTSRADRRPRSLRMEFLEMRAMLAADGFESGEFGTAAADVGVEITDTATIYYVNDDTVETGDWTTAPGDDANDGLTPDTPMASVSTVLDTYALVAGDTIKVDSGWYTLTSNIVISSEDNGYTIEGYHDDSYPDRRAVLDRDSFQSDSCAIELGGGDDVTLSYLVLTGGHIGLYAPEGADSNNVVLTDSEVFDNGGEGVSIEAQNEDIVLEHNIIYDSTTGIRVNGAPTAKILNNHIYDTGYGISVRGIHNIDDRVEVIGNEVHDNWRYGMYAYDHVRVAENTFYRQGEFGISLQSDGAVATNNVVHDSASGILSYDAEVRANRVYNNQGAGIRSSDGLVESNIVYDNSVAIETRGGDVRSNLVYGNRNDGIVLVYGRSTVANNTVYQSDGDAIQVEYDFYPTVLRNNILWVDNGYCLHVRDDNDSLLGDNRDEPLTSDYNTFFTTDNGQVALWGDQSFPDMQEWFYEFGLDEHSQTGDPRFADIDGLDDRLGFSETPVGPAQIIDDGMPGFETSGTWDAISQGYLGDAQLSRRDTAAWTFTDLEPSSWYEVAITWPADEGLSYNVVGKIYDGPLRLSNVHFNQRTAPDDFSAEGAEWETLGAYYLAGDTLTVRLSTDDYTHLPAAADAVRIQKVEGDHGADDDFSVQNTSPTIDAGAPWDYYLAEPVPNGGRINQGHSGNTSAATATPLDTVQVITPNGLTKYEQGDTVEIQWRSAGATETYPVALANTGGERVDAWLEDAYQAVAHDFGAFDTPVDTSLLANPAPQVVYQSFAYAAEGAGERIAWSLPVPDGDYTIRLHFAEPTYDAAGSRRFDVNLQGTTAVSEFDIVAAAGERYRATSLDLPVTATDGTGILLELINVGEGAALLSGLEIAAANPSGTPDPTFDLDLSVDGGASWNPIAVNQPVDRLGWGSYAWTAGPQTTEALVRVTAKQGEHASDVSDRAFQIANGGTEYYINVAGDSDFSDNQYTTAPGNNANSGKRPDRPMASLAALIAAYDLDDGDTVYVDAGEYSLLRNITLTEDDSGVRIQGPTGDARAVLDRGDQGDDSYVIELLGGDDITLSHLALTGGYIGLCAPEDADSNNVVLMDSEIFGNAREGIWVSEGNAGTLLANNSVHDQGSDGIHVDTAANTRVYGNHVFRNSRGIGVDGGSRPGSRVEVRGNDVHDNSGYGIYGENKVFISGNLVYRQMDSYGIALWDFSGETESNDVFDNAGGIRLISSDPAGRVRLNQVHHNISTGIRIRGPIYEDGLVIEGNVVYSNSVGIQGDDGRGEIRNNLVYANKEHGIVIRGSHDHDHWQLVNNTIYQPEGDAIRIERDPRYYEYFGLTLRNNVLWAEDGYLVSLPEIRGADVVSDYNTLYTAGSGKVALWGEREFATWEEWNRAIGLDQHSLTGDPLFVDPDGPDDRLGFSDEPVGTAQIVDDGMPEFDVAGTWMPGPEGYQGDTLAASGDDGASVASWTFTGLEPFAWYEVAVTWPADDDYTLYAPYRVYDGGTLVDKTRLDQRSVPGDFSADGADWETLGTYLLRGDTLVVTLANNGPGNHVTVADAVRIQEVEGDHGGDDDFRVDYASPTIDAGDPRSYFLAEPVPSGGRVNQGHLGNTADANLSPTPLVQVVSPNGREKLEEGVAAAIEWHAAGATEHYPVSLVNAGGEQVDFWSDDVYRTVARNTGLFAHPVDTSFAADPAPAAVYESYAYAANGEGEKIAWSLPVPDGDYTIRLHFAEPTYSSAGIRQFDINLQGATVVSAYDILAAAGARLRATTVELPVSVTGGAGISLELVNVGAGAALLSGLDIVTASPSGIADPTFDLELSVDGGTSWDPIAVNQPVDRFGRGSYTWVPGPQAGEALVRVTANQGANPSDVSDQPFQIGAGGSEYFVNIAGDTDFSDNQYTTAAGDDANTGKSPDRPMASVAALLEAYDLDPGDTIYVDVGEYLLTRNIILTSNDSGVHIQGPTSEGQAMLDREGPSHRDYVFEMAGADDVTVSDLVLTGADAAVYGYNQAGSDRLRVLDCEITGNDLGIILGRGNADVVIEGNVVRDHRYFAIRIEQVPRAVVSGNEVYDNGRGIYVQGVAIDAPALQPIVSDNDVHDNANHGIEAELQVLISGNTVYRNTGNYGIRAVYPSVTVIDNEVFDSRYGIYCGSDATILRNSVFHNEYSGIRSHTNSIIEGNVAYGNSVGISAAGEGEKIRGNVVYANTDHGIVVGGDGSQVTNNTVYQTIGDAIRVVDDNDGVVLRSNVLWTEDGNCISLSPDTQGDFTSDYNTLYVAGDGNVGLWHDREFATLADWNYATGLDGHSLSSDPQFVDPDVFDFRVQATSPTIDAGSPQDYYLAEPAPNGGRVNQGHTGNTSEATASPTQSVQLLTPNGLDKLESGEPTQVEWTSAGLTSSHPVALINAGGETVDRWLADGYQSGEYSSDANTASVDLSDVSDPAPMEVYQAVAVAESGAGNRMAWQLPVPDGQYTVRLHFAEPTLTTVGARQFDVNVQGVTVVSGYDVLASAGAAHKATALQYDATVVDGAGISIELVNATENPALISALELSAVNPAGTAVPTFDLQYSGDGGTTWSAVASGLNVDRYGSGSYTWAPGPETDHRLLRVTAAQGSQPADVSDRAFQVVAAGNEYYVNIAGDTDFSDNEYTTAAGDNRNSGKSPDRPMADLSALLAAYDLDAGDVVYVDAGTYSLIRNLRFEEQDSGVRIQGPTGESPAVLDRQLENSDSYVVEMAGGDDVTLSHLTLTGGRYGLVADDDAGSERLTVSGCEVFDNYTTGVRISVGNPDARLEGNSIHRHRSYGIQADMAARLQVIDNEVYNNSTGIGIVGSDTAADRVLVSGNDVRDNRSTGISATGQVLVTNNRVYDNDRSWGIYVSGQDAQTIGNIVFDNQYGIRSLYGAVVRGNRVFHNGAWGIYSSGGTVESNVVYSNSTGIWGQYNTGAIQNNLVYANTNRGISIQHSQEGHGWQVRNNTVYQPSGEAIRVGEDSYDVELRNNILWAGSGYVIYVTEDSLTGFTSDYNVLHRGDDPDAHVGYWGGTVANTLADWHAVSGQDLFTDNGDDSDDHSRQGPPLFVDVDGADDVLGYSTAGVGYDGGGDDNFYLSAGSPAIDRADFWAAPPTDREGNARVDDPASTNVQIEVYVETILGATGFWASGAAQGWQSDAGAWTLPLSFTFPFYGETYDRVTVSSKGFLKLAGSLSDVDGENSTEKLAENAIIAPMWDDLRTDGDGNDIFIDASEAGQVTIRWDATNAADGSNAQFAVTLMDTGEIQFHYGPGNANLTPTVGISRGDADSYLLSAYDGVTSLANAATSEIVLTPSETYRDMGAHEFLADGDDTIAPQVTAIAPEAIETEGTFINTDVPEIIVTFSEELLDIDGNAWANYELRRAVNGVFDDGDDYVYQSLVPSYTFDPLTGASVTVLDPGLSGATLPAGTYRLTIRESLHDVAGNGLDGDRDGSEGPDYVRTFVVDFTPTVTVDFLDTADPTPELTGTVDDPAATVSLIVNGREYAATNNGDGTWTLADGTISPALTGGVYGVAARATSAQGLVGSDATANELTVRAIDLGDAPDPAYATLLASNGARHVIDSRLYLGAGIDAETDGQPSAAADGDDTTRIGDEDGVTILMPEGRGGEATVEVDLSGATIDGYFSGWIDLNRNGSWNDAGEHVLADVQLAHGSVHTLTFGVPMDSAAGQTFARFRISTAAGLSFDGLAPDGEVEDYRLEIPEALQFDGTDADDLFEFRQVDSDLLVVINDTTYTIPAADTSEIRLYGLDGSDWVDLHGNDDSDDTFYGGPGESRLVLESGVVVRVLGCETVYAYAGTHGAEGDKAYFSGTPSDDTFAAGSGFAYMSGGGFLNATRQFELVEADVTSDGHDLAALYDTAGADVFHGRLEESWFELSTGIVNRAMGAFDMVRAVATSGTGDEAYLLGTPGDDTFVGGAGYAYLAGSGKVNSLRQFDYVEADVAGSGGSDTATLHDSSLVDLFAADGDEASFDHGDDGDLELMALGFAGVNADSTDGGPDKKDDDRAYNFVLVYYGTEWE